MNEDLIYLALTDQEWDDLTAVSTHYLLCTEWYEGDPNSGLIGSLATKKAHAKKVGRQRNLCKRIIEGER